MRSLTPKRPHNVPSKHKLSRKQPTVKNVSCPNGNNLLKVIFDNIIYSLQRYGGISVVWNELLSRAREDKDVQVTDDAMVLELFSDRKSKLVMGDYRNIKVTTKDDILLAEAILEGR